MIEVSFVEAFGVLFALAIQAVGVGIAYQSLRGKMNAQEKELARHRRIMVLAIRLSVRRTGNVEPGWIEDQLAAAIGAD